MPVEKCDYAMLLPKAPEMTTGESRPRAVHSIYETSVLGSILFEEEDCVKIA